MPRIIEHLYSATLAAIIAIGTPIAALAFDQSSTAEVNVDSAGVGIKGYDPVAYFTVGKPTPGDKLYSATHAGVTYHFASAGNRDLFNADPNRYAPAYGGFCAMGVALEKKFDGDPQAWYIGPDGRLYLNVTVDTQKVWLKDVSGNIGRGNNNWPTIKSRTPKSLN